MRRDAGSRVSDTSSWSGLSETALEWHLERLVAKHCGRCCWWMAQETSGLIEWTADIAKYHLTTSWHCRSCPCQAHPEKHTCVMCFRRTVQFQFAVRCCVQIHNYHQLLIVELYKYWDVSHGALLAGWRAWWCVDNVLCVVYIAVQSATNTATTNASVCLSVHQTAALCLTDADRPATLTIVSLR